MERAVTALTSKRMRRVPVPGGGLTVAAWGDGPPVLGLHGVTSSHLAWSLVADRLPGRLLIAPDLRGRGASADLPGPWGMATHADDAVAVLDALGIERAVVAGHSMGGFAAVVLADRHPERVERLLLVDGGLPLPLPPGMTSEEALAATIGPAADRLAMTFDSVEAHRGFWRAHPAFAGGLSDYLEAYVDYDLTGRPPSLRSRASMEAVRADSQDLLGGDVIAPALARLSVPTLFLRAERGMLDQPGGLYPADQVAAAAAEMDLLQATTVAGTNHYTIVLGEAGAQAVADALT